MPSEFNHIDEFFRSKEQEAAMPETDQDKHWQQMKEQLIVSDKPSAGFRNSSKKLYWQAAVLILIISLPAALLFRYIKSGTNEIVVDNSKVAVYPDTTKPFHRDSLVISKLVVAGKTDTLKFKIINSKNVQHQLKINPVKIDSEIIKLKFDTVKQVITPELQAFQQSPKESYEKFFDQLKKPVQKFSINAARDTTIICNEGTTVFIPAHSFQSAQGMMISSLVTISVKEFYNFADIIGNKLSTTSNGLPIITAGMIHIEARSGNQNLVISPGRVLELQMPAKKIDPEMQLFIAASANSDQVRQQFMDTTAVGNTGINWIPVKPKPTQNYKKTKTVNILNLTNNPYQVDYKHEYNPSKIKSVARFMIPWYCSYSTEEIKTMLIKRYGRYYDEIKVTRAWKPWSKKARANEKYGPLPEWYDSYMVGDTVSMNIGIATRLKQITRKDSLKYENLWRQDSIDAQNSNQSYNEFLGIKEKYNFKIESLGWINCDKFSRYPESDLTNVEITNREEFNGAYFHSVLVFNKENLIMQGYMENKKISFKKIPKGEKVSLVCIGVKNGKAYTCIRDFSVGKENIDQLEFSESSPEEFREKLRRFGSVSQR